MKILWIIYKLKSVILLGICVLTVPLVVNAASTSNATEMSAATISAAVESGQLGGFYIEFILPNRMCHKRSA